MAINVTVDGFRVGLPAGSSVLDAILAAGVTLPHLCKDPERPRLGTCRTCLVGIEGWSGTPAACATPAVDDMVVHTDDPEAMRVRTGVLQLTVDMLPEEDLSRLAELGAAAALHDVHRGRFLPASPLPSREQEDDSNAFWVLDHRRCILCQRCVMACQEVQHIGAIAMLDRGTSSEIGTFQHGPVASSNCTSCGQCWATCPTLAIRLKHSVAEGAQSGWTDLDIRRSQRRTAP